MYKSSDLKIFSFLVFSIFLFILFVPNVYAVPPVTTTQQFEQGYVILEAEQTILTLGEYYTYHFFLYNTSNGVVITNESVWCQIFSSDSNGNIVFASNVSFDTDGKYWYYNISKDAYKTPGYYSYGVNCQNSGYGGALANYFEVTYEGEDVTEAKGILYFLVTLFSFIVFGVLLYIFISIDGSNPRNSEGEFLGINVRKYVKTGLFPLVYVVFLWTFNFIIGLSQFLQLSLFNNTLEFMFLVLIRLTYPVIIITFFVIFYQIIKDMKIKKEYKSLWSRY